MEISHYVHLNFCVYCFVGILFKIHFVHILWNLHQLYIFIGIFVQPLCIGHIIIGLYRAAHETGQFQVPVPKTQDNKPKSTDNNQYLHYHHQTYTWTRIKHDTCWSSGTTPYLHPHLLNDPKGRKLQYHQQGKKLQQTLSLLWTLLLVRSHLYWGSRLARVPSYKVQIHQRTSRKYWAQEHFKGM